MINPKEEKTFLMIKPDGVKKGLIGEIIRRIEQPGLKVIAMEMVKPSVDQIDSHYPKDEKWIKRLGEKTMKTYEKYGYDAVKEVGTDDLLEIGQMVRGWLLEYMTCAPIVKIVVEGVHAVDMIRKMVGNTIPAFAEMGTIRGDFSVDSAVSANKDKRAIFNIVHASETPQEAEHEINFWFSPERIYGYSRCNDKFEN